MQKSPALQALTPDVVFVAANFASSFAAEKNKRQFCSGKESDFLLIAEKLPPFFVA